MKHLMTFVLLAVSCLSLMCCNPGEKKTDDTVRVCASTYPIWLFTRSIMDGTGIEPKLVVPADVGCPHDYALTPRDLMSIQNSEKTLFLENGGGLDAQIVKSIREAAPKVVIADTSKGLEIIEGETHEHEHEAEEHEEHETEGHVHEGANGHFFASPYEAVNIVRTISKELTAHDAEHAEIYSRNTNALVKQLNSLCNEYEQTLGGLKDKKVATQHDVFSYLFRDLKFEEPHVIFADPNAAISPAEIVAMANEFEKDGVCVIFTEPQYPDNLAQLISKETKTPVVKLDPVVSGPENPPMDYYVSKMRENMNLMKQALTR